MVLVATRILKASSLPGATDLSGCNNTASLRYALFISSLKERINILSNVTIIDIVACQTHHALVKIGPMLAQSF